MRLVQPSQPRAWVAALPCVGPVVGWVRASSQKRGKVAVSVVIHPSPRHTETKYVVMVHMRRTGGRWRHETDMPFIDALTSKAFTADAEPDEIYPLLEKRAICLEALDPAWVDGVDTALLFLTVHHDVPATAATALAFMGPSAIDPEGKDLATAPKSPAIEAIVSFLAAPHGGLEPALLRLSKFVLLAADQNGRPPGEATSPLVRTPALTLAIANGQCPAGVLDQQLAWTSYRRLRDRLDAPSDAGKPQLLLLLGDQVHLNDSAGLFDPTVVGGALNLAYQRGLGSAAFRAVTSRLPTYMLAGRHECRLADPAAEEYEDEPWRHYLDRQEVLNPPALRPVDDGGNSYPVLPDGSFECSPGGWPLFALETRFSRAPRLPDNYHTAKMVSDAMMTALETSLTKAQQAHGDLPKFIAMSSVLLPPERPVEQSHWSSDGWAGFPASRARLLAFIANQGIRNVVLLQGGGHLAIVSELTLSTPGNDCVPIYSIVSPALYAPWLFANDEAADFEPEGDFVLRHPGMDDIEGTIVSRHVEDRSGFAVVKVQPSPDGSLSLQVELDVERDAEEEVRRIEYQLAVRAPPLSARDTDS